MTSSPPNHATRFVAPFRRPDSDECAWILLGSRWLHGAASASYSPGLPCWGSRCPLARLPFSNCSKLNPPLYRSEKHYIHVAKIFILRPASPLKNGDAIENGISTQHLLSQITPSRSKDKRAKLRHVFRGLHNQLLKQALVKKRLKIPKVQTNYAPEFNLKITKIYYIENKKLIFSCNYSSGDNKNCKLTLTEILEIEKNNIL